MTVNNEDDDDIEGIITRLTTVAENLTNLAAMFAKLTLEVNVLTKTVQDLMVQSTRSSVVLVDTADGLTEVVRSTAEILRLMSLRKNGENNND